MTVGTLILLAVTGSLVLFKAALLALAVALLAKTMVAESRPLASRPAPARLPAKSPLSR